MLIDATVQVVETRGPQLGDPHSSGIAQSRHAHMRKLQLVAKFPDPEIKVHNFEPVH